MIDIRVGDCREVLASLPAETAQCCVTSPPYFGLRDYGVSGQIGLEQSPADYVAELVSVFREVRRALKDDGTLWLNIGDAYAGSWGARGRGEGTNAPRPDFESKHGTAAPARNGFAEQGIKPKDLMLIPARVALALQEDGWWLRSDIIWHKPNPMPESVTDRPTCAHEHIFLFAKSPRYFYDHAAIREPAVGQNVHDLTGGRYSPPGQTPHTGSRAKAASERLPPDGMRNARNVWSITTKPYRGAHFATMPVDLAERCILAGSRPGDVVLDPFGGAGTTGLAAQQSGRSALLIELNPDYASLASDRLAA